MTRQKLGIVSSYDEQCGNASYTHVLKEEFSRYYDVEIITVNARSLSGRYAERLLTEICARIAACDVVNIQFESGLYGRSPKSIAHNVRAMIRSARRLVFTMHRIHVPTEVRMVLLNTMFSLLSRHNVVHTLRSTRAHLLVDKMSTSIVEELKRKNKAAPGAVTVMVHTKRERDLLEYHFGLDNVVDFPITFLNRSQIAENLDNREAIKAEVLQRFRLDPERKYIGIFGFLSENKGHHVAVEAMRYLPPEYTLLIFGGQHPMSIEPYDFGHMMSKPELFSRNRSPYIASLIDLAREIIAEDLDEEVKDTTRHRIRFMGTLDDPSFIQAITAMDFVVLPYLESGQGGSGNASLVLELQGKAVLARNHAFMQLERYYPNCFAMVDMANPLELARIIQTWGTDFSQGLRRAIRGYNIENNILVHREGFEHGATAANDLKLQRVNAVWHEPAPERLMHAEPVATEDAAMAAE